MVENPLPLSGVSPLEAGAMLARSPVRNKCNQTAVAWKVREDSNFPQRFNSYLIGALDRHGHACAIERAADLQQPQLRSGSPMLTEPFAVGMHRPLIDIEALAARGCRIRLYRVQVASDREPDP